VSPFRLNPNLNVKRADTSTESENIVSRLFLDDENRVNRVQILSTKEETRLQKKIIYRCTFFNPTYFIPRNINPTGGPLDSSFF